MSFCHEGTKEHKVEDFATKAQRQKETQSGGICHKGTKTRRNTKWRNLLQRHEDTKKRKEEMINTKAIYYKIINLVTLSALASLWRKTLWQKTLLQKLCGQTFII